MACNLKILGGDSELPEEPVKWPVDDPDVMNAMHAAYADGSWGKYHGNYCQQLATEVSSFHNVRHAHLCCSGTVGVLIALKGLGVGPGDEVIMAGYDFSGNFRAVEDAGAFPVLVDVDPSSWCLRADQIESAISEKTKAVLVSHLHGGLAQMVRITEIAKSHGLGVVEDACQSNGATVDGKAAGSLGDVGVWSFGGSKLLTSGRGGAIFTDDDVVFQRMKVFCDRGNDAYPLSELQAAVLIPQLRKLNDRNKIRAANAKKILETASKMSSFRPVCLPRPGDEGSYYKIAFLIRDMRNSSRALLIKAAKAEGLALDAGFRGFTKRSKRRCRKPVSLVASETASTHTLVLHHPVLLSASSTIDRVVNALWKIDSAWDRGLLIDAELG